VLERIEHALEQARTAVARQTNALASADDGSEDKSRAARAGSIDTKLEECSKRVPAAAARAEKAVRMLESQVEAGCTGLENWLSAIRTLDLKLGRWTGPPV
jgi:hypothetical protein